MTLHRSNIEAEEAPPPREEKPISLPGEEPPTLVALPEERTAAFDGRAGLALRGRLEAAIKRLRRDAGLIEAHAFEQTGEPAEKGEGGALDGDGEADAPPVGQQSNQPAKPLWKKPAFIGGASVLAIAVVAASALIVSSNAPKQIRIAETGMGDADQTRPLIAPSATLATMPKPQIAESPARPPVAGDKSDQLREILSLRPAAEKRASGAPAKDGGAPAPVKAEAAPLAAAEAAKSQSPAAALSGDESTEPVGRVAEKPVVKPGEPEAKAPHDVGVAAKAAAGAVEVRVASVPPDEPKETIPAPTSSAASPRSPVIDDVKKETEALALVTQFGAELRDLQKSLKALEEAQKTAAASTDAKLSDFERRMVLGEASRMVAAIHADGQAGVEGSDAATGSISPQAPSKTDASPAATTGKSSGKAHAQPMPEEKKRYRIQAASPGLAMLAPIDSSGEEEPPLQVGVGKIIPGYGKVKSIEQRGASWVVQAELGAIP